MTCPECAVKSLLGGMNCAQSVVTTFCEKYGVPAETALKIACAFGGGVRSGEICGAVSGSVMVIGLKSNQNNPDDKPEKELCCSEAVKFINAFRERNGSITCRELLGLDLSVDENKAKADELGLFKSVCPKLVRSATELLEEMGY